MNLINKKEMLLVGIETITSNQAELSGQGKIPAIVQKFYGEYLGQISNRTDHSVLAVYTDFASDEQGEYTYFIGVCVKKALDIPAELGVRSIPAAQYDVFSSRRGEIGQVVLEVWQGIWQDFALKKRRAFSADFEVYDECCLDSKNAQVDVYVAVLK